MSQITTHVLDTSIGKPAQGISIALEQKNPENWLKISEGITNADGRLSDLIPKEKILPKGIYRLSFDTTSYFQNQNIQTFYPQVTIEFEITDSSHYHVPLLLNPFWIFNLPWKLMCQKIQRNNSSNYQNKYDKF